MRKHALIVAEGPSLTGDLTVSFAWARSVIALQFLCTQAMEDLGADMLAEAIDGTLTDDYEDDYDYGDYGDDGGVQ